MTIAWVFPGQGSQKIGMGKSIFQNSSAAKEFFNKIDDTLNEKFSELMFEGPDDILTLTKNAQPALFASSLAIIETIESLSRKSIKNFTNFVAGHSLGEYSALACAKSLEISDAIKLLRLRGLSMQDAVPEGQGGMAAILASNIKNVEKLIVFCSNFGLLQIANDNSDGQTVISGSMDAIDQSIKLSKEFGIKKIIKLNVSAPFHCDLMKPAESIMKEELNKTKVNDALIKIICNYDAKIETNSIKLKQNLISQIINKVRWRETIDLLFENNVQNFVEVGTGRVLSTLVRRSYPDVNVYNIENFEDIVLFLEKNG